MGGFAAVSLRGSGHPATESAVLPSAEPAEAGRRHSSRETNLRRFTCQIGRRRRQQANKIQFKHHLLIEYNCLCVCVCRPLEVLVPNLLSIFAPLAEPCPSPSVLAELGSVKLRALESYNSLLCLLDVSASEPGQPALARLGLPILTFLL